MNDFDNIAPFGQPMQETGKLPGADDYRPTPTRDQLAEPPRQPTDPTAAKISRLQVENAIARHVNGLQDGALATVQAAVREWFTTTAEGYIKPTAEAPMTSKGLLQIDELDSYLKRNQPYMFKTHPQQGYYQAPPLKKSQMSNAQKAKYIRENGGDAYERLDW